jgi:hypothetical protein
MVESGIEHLRVRIANERTDLLALLAEVVSGLGRDVIACEVGVKEIGAVTAREHPVLARYPRI